MGGSQNKYLIVIGTHKICKDFEGDNLEGKFINENKLIIKKCYFNHYNLDLLREIFPHFNPSFCGLRSSFGTSDRLGIAIPAHL